MAIQNTLEVTPLAPSERQPGDFSEHDRVFTLYFRTWMDQAELVHGVISDIVETRVPAPNGSRGFVSLKTTKTPDNRTGSIIGIDVNSAALIPESAWEDLADEATRQDWVANGSVAWLGEREMLEAALDENVTEHGLVWPLSDKEHDDTYGHHHPSRAREHIRIVPGSYGGKVAAIKPFDYSQDNH